MAGFTSESLAAFHRNGWPTCIGISGWLGSEYAGRLLQSAVRQNLQPVQEDLKELQARTKKQTDTAIRTLKWVADEQNLLAETEQKLVDLQNKSINDLESLKFMVEGIKIVCART